MERSGPHVQLKLKWDKKKRKREKKSHFFSPFCAISDNGREVEREMREIPPSLYDLLRSGGRNPLSQDLKSKYSSRAARGHRNQEFSLKIRAESSRGHGF